MKIKLIKKLAVLFFVAFGFAVVFGVLNLLNSSYTASAEKASEETVTRVYSVENSDDFESVWETAVKFSVDNQKTVEVVLQENITAKNQSFGDSKYFYGGAILIPEKADIILDLHGCNIDRDCHSVKDVERSVIKIVGKLTLKDSLETGEDENYESGKITGGMAALGAGVQVFGGTFIMEGGTIDLNYGLSIVQGGGNGVCVLGGQFIMNGGKISNNESVGNNGGGVYVSSANEEDAFIMNGGIICKNYTLSNNSGSGGVYINRGIFTMNGGKICNNALYDGRGGGGVYVGFYECVFNINGGEIFDNESTSSVGGIYTDNSGTLNIKNNPKIKNNITSGNENNFNINNVKLTVNGSLTDGAEIRVNGDVGTVITEKYSDYNDGVDPAEFFNSVEGKFVVLRNGEVQISDTLSFTIPTLSVTEFTYDGNEKQVNLEGFITDSMELSGDLSNSEIGEYTTTVSLKNAEDCWTDGTKDPINFKWTIKEATDAGTKSDISGNNVSNGVTGSSAGSVTDSHNNAVKIGIVVVSIIILAGGGITLACVLVHRKRNLK